MEKQKPYVIILATKLEAKPLVQKLNAHQVEAEPYFVHQFSCPYDGRAAYIVISGIGKHAASAATRYAFLRYQPEYILNCGLAGGLAFGLELGELYYVDTVTDHNYTERIAYEDALLLGAGPWDSYMGLSLVTVDEPVFDPKKRDELAVHSHLVDMEGYAIARVCAEKEKPCFMFKVISDYADEQGKKTVYKHLDQLTENLAVQTCLALEKE